MQSTPVDGSKERLARFDKWVYAALLRHLNWPKGPGPEIFRARSLINLLCLRLAQRGFYLDGKELAGVIDRILSDIGTRQKKGEIIAIWAYMRGAIESYVPSNADQLRSLCVSLGCHHSDESSSPALVRLAGERFSNGANRKLKAKIKKRHNAEAEKLQGELIGKGRITQLSRQALLLRDQG